MEYSQIVSDFSVLYKFLCRKNRSSVLTKRMLLNLSTNAAVVLCDILQKNRDVFEHTENAPTGLFRISLREIERNTNIHSSYLSSCVKELAYKGFIHLHYHNKRYHVRIHPQKLMSLVGLTSDGIVLSNTKFQEHPNMRKLTALNISNPYNEYTGPAIINYDMLIDSSVCNISTPKPVSKSSIKCEQKKEVPEVIITFNDSKKPSDSLLSLINSFSRIIYKYEKIIDFRALKNIAIRTVINQKFKNWMRDKSYAYFHKKTEEITEAVVTATSRVTRKATKLFKKEETGHPLVEYAISLPYMTRHKQGTKVYTTCATWLDQLEEGTFFKKRKKLTQFVIDSNIDKSILDKKFSKDEIKVFLERLSYLKECDIEKHLAAHTLADMMYNPLSSTHYYSFLAQVMDEQKWNFIKSKTKMDYVSRQIDEKKIFIKTMPKCLEVLRITKNNKRDYHLLVTNLMKIRDFFRWIPANRIPNHDEVLHDYCVNHLMPKFYAGYTVRLNDFNLSSKSFRDYLSVIWHEGATGLLYPILTLVDDYLAYLDSDKEKYVQVLMQHTINVRMPTAHGEDEIVPWHKGRKIMSSFKFAKKLIEKGNAVLVDPTVTLAV